jgi:hypothetical protein
MAYWRISVSETAGKSKGDIGLEYVLENLIEIFHKTAEAAIGTGDCGLVESLCSINYNGQNSLNLKLRLT